ncbi:NepR family anti-sigma factor [Microvirga thermotolerans]|uniref:Anti-sigma factor NepR domain-containing protein n=1 Tax=Microvirga thermotolerans TaxID=2651334 RepID=A0A5P9JWQ8_9HYPH|nr:NepR family anti-sigma factor [Microvirga thermotolerans]QFU17252.1 hypothetical protein GDR74_14045 [Microvirga thermotolerans]
MNARNRKDDPSDEFEPIPGMKRSSPALTRSVQAQLGQRLRQFYETLALGETPVPERFIEIINRLEQRMPEKQQS